MPIPTPQQVIEAMTAKNISFACRSCGNDSDIKIHVAGLNTTALDAAATNASLSSARFLPMALYTCGRCGETRLYHLELLGLRAS